MRYISFGAGVQSTAMLVMSNLEECQRADAAIFADTQDEPGWVYNHLERMKKWSGIPIEVVSIGKLSATFGTPTRSASVPAFTLNEQMGMLRRQCTREYKITPIEKKVRELMGYKPRQRVKGKSIAMIGISIDEAQRAKPSQTPWVINEYPLIDAMMNRQDCIEYLRKNWPYQLPKKSSCVFCPYHSDSFWKMLKENHPKEWAKAVDADRAIRDMSRAGRKFPLFVHRSLVPLDRVDLNENQNDLFGNECEGYCGV